MTGRTHVSDRGTVHLGDRTFCVSLDCIPPSIPAREGDLVQVTTPDGSAHRWRISSTGPGHIVFAAFPWAEEA